jgi:hypothetical protein
MYRINLKIFSKEKVGRMLQFAIMYYGFAGLKVSMKRLMAEKCLCHSRRHLMALPKNFTIL